MWHSTFQILRSRSLRPAGLRSPGLKHPGLADTGLSGLWESSSKQGLFRHSAFLPFRHSALDAELQDEDEGSQVEALPFSHLSILPFRPSAVPPNFHFPRNERILIFRYPMQNHPHPGSGFHDI